jgi:D-glycero-alpha-D-manno-heptose-7-phosphate kinase
MLIARSPLRISLGGGGTDLPSYYKKYGGFLMAATINKYVYISLAETFNKKFIIKYSDFEEEKKISNIKHPLFRETLRKMNVKTPLNISSHADIPAGTGMGSSGCFAVTLINALSYYQRKQLSKRKIAELACYIEIDKLKEPVGKQDQFTAAYGGINEYIFHKDGFVEVNKLKLKNDIIQKLQKNLVIYFTGYSRKSSKILVTQNNQTISRNNIMIKNLHEVKELAYDFKRHLLKGDLDSFGNLMDIHWELKKKRSKFMSNRKINYIYDFARFHGALGGKLVGAGGGGFLILYTNNPLYLKKKLSIIGLSNVDFKFDFEGTKIITL